MCWWNTYLLLFRIPSIMQRKKNINRSGKEFGFRCWSINCLQYAIRLNKFIAKKIQSLLLEENLSRHLRINYTIRWKSYIKPYSYTPLIPTFIVCIQRVSVTDTVSVMGWISVWTVQITQQVITVRDVLTVTMVILLTEAAVNVSMLV